MQMLSNSDKMKRNQIYYNILVQMHSIQGFLLIHL